MAASVLIGAGIGLSETLTNDAILASAPAQRAGSASAVSETAYELGAVLGTAVLGSVLGAAYARALDVPSSIGPVFAHDARETLGGAVALAGRIGGVEGHGCSTPRRSRSCTRRWWRGGRRGGAAVVAATVVVGLRGARSGSGARTVRGAATVDAGYRPFGGITG